jgi:phage shock protein A
MQEQMNKAMSTLSEQVGEDVPTLDEVREKIETRYAKAQGMAELQDMSVESKMLEVEQASINVEAQARLSEIRSKLGIEEAPAAAPTAQPATATQPATSPAEPSADTPSDNHAEG